jgi:hypothetical protein
MWLSLFTICLVIAICWRAILSEPYKGRPGCTYCGFCQAFGCHVGAKSSILVTKLPEADATGNFKLLTGTMVGRSRNAPYRPPLRPDEKSKEVALSPCAG